MNNNDIETWKTILKLIDEINIDDFDSLPNNTATQVMNLIDFLKHESINAMEKKSVWEKIDVGQCINIVSTIFKIIAESSN